MFSSSSLVGKHVERMAKATNRCVFVGEFRALEHFRAASGVCSTRGLSLTVLQMLQLVSQYLYSSK